jgi:TetR/AcrR family tetracycline transcriptional repressor
MTEIAPFPVLAEAVGPLLANGSINTESIFEGGLTYMIDGIRAQLAGQPQRTAVKKERRPKAPPQDQ